MPFTHYKVPNFGMHCLVFLELLLPSTLAFSTSTFNFQLCNVLRLSYFQFKKQSIQI
jgi:hypothetical protein